MKVHDYGEVLLCRDITFEDDKLDMKYGHPGIVLLPSSENEEELYCLYMTSDINRAQKEKNKYVKNIGKVVKESYINIQQIVKRSNKFEIPITYLDNDQFYELLQEFYNYQMSLETPKKEFLDIKSKVEVLLELLEFNKRNNIEESITREQIDKLSEIKDSRKRKIIYGAEAMLSRKNEIEGYDVEFFESERERKYFYKLLEVYDRIKKVDFNKINLNDTNNELRNIYLDVRNNNYLLNINSFFSDISTIIGLTDPKSNGEKVIKTFMRLELERDAMKNKAREEKKATKFEKAAAKKKRAARYNEKTKYRRSIAKYGNSEFFK